MSETKKCPKCGGNIVQGPGFYECLLCKYCWPFETGEGVLRRQLAAKDKQIADLTRERDEMRAACAAAITSLEVSQNPLVGTKGYITVQACIDTALGHLREPSLSLALRVGAEAADLDQDCDTAIRRYRQAVLKAGKKD